MVYRDNASRRGRATDASGPELARAVLIVDQIETTSSHESFCVRLRRERERRQIPLSSISANTKISVALFESLERGDISRWPSGIFRKSFIRAYATAIGLDPDTTVREFLEAFPDPLDAAAATLASPQAAAVAKLAAVPAAAPAAPAPTVPPTAAESAAAEPMPAPTATVPSKPAAIASVRVKVVEEPTPFVRGRLLDGMRHRLAAIACDAGVVIGIALLMYIAFDKFWLPLGVAMLAYYLGGILLLGNTPGVCLWAPVERGGPHYNHPSDGPRRDTRPESAPAHPAWHLRMPAR
jgi:hypothetical protein